MRSRWVIEMNMNRTMLITLLAVVATTTSLAHAEDKPSFANLNEAVSFIVTCLDQDATKRFDAAFVAPRSGAQMHTNVFIGLKRMNKTKPLTALYQGKDFPTNQPAFWLGGHFKELGCINIRFVHTNGVWQLADTFYCK